MTRFKSVAVVGLGKLGLPLAYVLLDSHPDLKVCGYDTNFVPFDQHDARNEPDLKSLIDKHSARFTLCDSTDSVVSQSEAALIVLPTPSTHEEPRFNDAIVHSCIAQLCRSLVHSNVSEYTIVVVSTVMPGTCRKRFQPLLDEAIVTANRPLSIRLLYSPEYVALGRTVAGMRRPDQVTVGVNLDEPAAIGDADRLYATLVGVADYNESFPYFSRGSWEDVELAKLSINTMLILKSTMANAIGMAGRAVGHVNAATVSQMLGRDCRIAPAFLGFGFGACGPCLPRDIRAMAQLMLDNGLSAGGCLLSLSNQSALMPRHIYDWLAKSGAIACGLRNTAVLGLTYREGSHVLDEAQPLRLAQLLDAEGHLAAVYDPDLLPAQRADIDLSLGARLTATAAEAVAKADTVVLTKRNILVTADDLAGKRVFDVWSSYPAELFVSAAAYSRWHAS